MWSSLLNLPSCFLMCGPLSEFHQPHALIAVLCFFFTGTHLATTLCKELDVEVVRYRSHVFADSTKSTYRTQFNSFMCFCNFMGYSPFPATSLLICKYATLLARSLKFSSVKNYLNIIGLLH